MNLATIHVKTVLALIAVMITGCLSPEFTVTTSGTFSGTYVSFEGTYAGPMSFDFDQVEEAIDVWGVITVDADVIEFAGEGTLTRNPARLDLDVKGTDFQMRVEGELVNGHLTGSYEFISERWGNDEGSIELGRSGG